MELPYVNTLGNFSLSCTLTMAFMGLKVSALSALSLPGFSVGVPADTMAKNPWLVGIFV